MKVREHRYWNCCQLTMIYMSIIMEKQTIIGLQILFQEESG